MLRRALRFCVPRQNRSFHSGRARFCYFRRALKPCFAHERVQKPGLRRSVALWACFFGRNSAVGLQAPQPFFLFYFFFIWVSLEQLTKGGPQKRTQQSPCAKARAREVIKRKRLGLATHDTGLAGWRLREVTCMAVPCPPFRACSSAKARDLLVQHAVLRLALGERRRRVIFEVLAREEPERVPSPASFFGGSRSQCPSRGGNRDSTRGRSPLPRQTLAPSRSRAERLAAWQRAGSAVSQDWARRTSTPSKSIMSHQLSSASEHRESERMSKRQGDQRETK